MLSDYRKHVTDPLDLLSSREREVLQMIAEGKTNKEIAGTLNLSVYTVDAHRGKIMEKLNLHSIQRIGAIRGAQRADRLRKNPEARIQNRGASSRHGGHSGICSDSDWMD